MKLSIKRFQQLVAHHSRRCRHAPASYRREAEKTAPTRASQQTACSKQSSLRAEVNSHKKNTASPHVDKACLEETVFFNSIKETKQAIYFCLTVEGLHPLTVFHHLPLSERPLWFISWRMRICMATHGGMKIHSIRSAWLTVAETKSACRYGNTHSWLFLCPHTAPHLIPSLPQILI